MSEKMIPLVFIPDINQKKKAIEICENVVGMIEKESLKIEEKCYVMQMLLESFESSFNVDIRNGLSFGEK